LRHEALADGAARDNALMAQIDPWSSRVIPELRGMRVLLRRLKPSDIDDRRALGRNAEESRMYGGGLRFDEPMTLEQAEAWYTAGADNAARTRWAIECEGRCIGSCTLTGTGSLVRYAIGISDASLWGKGIGTEAGRLVLDYAFGQPQVERVELMVLAYNERAIKSYEKAGFRVREVLKESAQVDGEKFDDWMMEIDRATHDAR
jgi:[ribosomal protein S5]-alanine N-acetyltransferase